MGVHGVGKLKGLGRKFSSGVQGRNPGAGGLEVKPPEDDDMTLY